MHARFPRFLGAARLTLEVSPRLSPSEVGQFYDEARRHYGLRPERIRDLLPETAELAVFVATRNDGRSWGEVQAEWRRVNPKARKAKLANFTRKAHSAYLKVTGKPLEWRRGRGRAKEDDDGDT